MIDERVGYATTSHLEAECKKSIEYYWKVRDLPNLVQYIEKYKKLVEYNKREK